ncbi:hypothetical protein BGZ97_001188 [Linnemannia gamsii]|uniref:EI24-domain-containing protein n=1 Tax=Linnemannia gamsii TaxID=64522 RepID=A0A9P6R1P0_9FUNG|nr:hypothetical protein BGZ97_001188 [Linnemannia gamsii]
MIVPSSYPAQGVLYFLGHPSLITSLICPIILTVVWGLAATIFGFAYLLKTQAHALIKANCPAGLAWFVSVIFVLLEIAVIIVLFYLIILPIYQDALFDRVLKLRGLRHVLEANRGNDIAKCMRGVNGGLFILLCQIIVLILTLPLNLIPILGQILYATINGWILTFGIRFHYDAEIRNIPVSQSRREAWGRKSEYTSFGAVAVGLEMIPIANLLFMWTNIVGCALWVADEIEKEERRQLQIAQAQLQQQEQQQQQQQLLQQGGGGPGSISAMSTPESSSSYSPPNTAALLGSNHHQQQYQQLYQEQEQEPVLQQPTPVQKGLTMMPAHRK